MLRTRRHLDYHEANEWALDAGAVVDAIEVEAARNPWRELLKLIELSVGRVVKVILKSDDSSGMMGDVAHRLLAIHEHVALAGVAEPKALARWMIKFGIDDQDFFTIDPVLYAPALGDKGMALYRNAIAERSAHGRVPFAVKHTTERFAVLDGDVEAIVSLLGQDLTSPHQYTRVAAAPAVLGRRDRGSLVDVLLDDGEVESAWGIAAEDGDDLGDDRLVRPAEAHEVVDPAASVDLYVRVVESILETTDRRAYRAAVKQLKNAKRAAIAAGLSTEHQAYLVGLREEHRRRPTLAAMLDKLIEG